MENDIGMENNDKTTVLSIGVGKGWEELTKFTDSYRRKWAECNGCEVITDFLDSEVAKKKSSRPPSWLKLLRIEELVKSGRNVIWMDADAVPTKNLALSQLTPPEQAIVVGTDINGMNCGLMGFRSGTWTEDLLKLWWSYPCNVNNSWREQRALHDMVKNGQFPGKVLTFPQKPIFLHAAGCGGSPINKINWLKQNIKPEEMH